MPRPSQGWLPARAGSPLAGRVSHPLDDESKFHGVIATPPIPIDQQSLVALFFLHAELIAIAIDTEDDGDEEPAVLIDRSIAPAGDVTSLCRIPGDLAEGDFLLAQDDYITFEQPLQAFRSAPRQACGLGFEGALGVLPLLLGRRLRRRGEMGG